MQEIRIPDTTEVARRLGRVLEDWIQDVVAGQESFLGRHKLLDAQGAADFLGLSADTVRELAVRWERGDRETGLPGVKLGREWRFEPESLLVVLRRRMGVAPLFDKGRGDAAAAEPGRRAIMVPLDSREGA